MYFLYPSKKQGARLRQCRLEDDCPGLLQIGRSTARKKISSCFFFWGGEVHIISVHIRLLGGEKAILVWASY